MDAAENLSADDGQLAQELLPGVSANIDNGDNDDGDADDDEEEEEVEAQEDDADEENDDDGDDDDNDDDAEQLHPAATPPSGDSSEDGE